MAIAFYDGGRLPVDIERGATGGPMFSTSIAETAAGREARNQNWSSPRYKWQFGFGTMPMKEYRELVSFFNARRGSFEGFRFKDWSEYGVQPMPVSGKVSLIEAPADPTKITSYAGLDWWLAVQPAADKDNPTAPGVHADAFRHVVTHIEKDTVKLTDAKGKDITNKYELIPESNGYKVLKKPDDANDANKKLGADFENTPPTTLDDAIQADDNTYSSISWAGLTKSHPVSVFIPEGSEDKQRRLATQYGDVERIIHKPVKFPDPDDAALNVRFFNYKGAEESTVDLDYDTGIVSGTFEELTKDKSLRWTGQFDVPVRFVEDQLSGRVLFVEARKKDKDRYVGEAGLYGAAEIPNLSVVELIL